MHLLFSKHVDEKISTRYKPASMNLTPILTYPNCWLSLFCAAVMMDTLSSLGRHETYLNNVQSIISISLDPNFLFFCMFLNISLLCNESEEYCATRNAGLINIILPV